jgi:hypothetical protein
MDRLNAERAVRVIGPAQAAALPGRRPGRGMRPGMRPDVAMGKVRTS